MILDAFVPMLGRMVAGAVKERLDTLLGVPGEMERLESTLEDLVNVLGDAEMKRITDTAVDAWVRELKDVMYDADDVLDRWRMEARSSSDAPKRSFPGAGCCAPLLTCFRDPALAHAMAAQIKELNRRLESVCRRSSMFRFVSASSSVPLRQQLPTASSGNGKTSSVIVHADLIGEKIEEDGNRLVEALIADDLRENVLAVGITGAGGIGKTTLAKRVFADQRVRDEFDLRVWVCVSQDVNEADLLWSVLVGAGGGHQLQQQHDATPDRSSLEPALQRAVSGKKVLLVLDDVWSDVAWKEVLQNAFRAGARGGSRVLVTTRKETVARQMKAVHIHRVEKLQPEDGWRLLKNQVVLGRNPTDIENFKDIGMEIVTRCDCLPLAIKTVGGLLCTKERTFRDWEEVSRSAAWSVAGLPEEVHNAIYLSYADLPPHLKQCFLHCSLFPKDEVIKRVDVVQMWIAEGFVQEDGSSALLEDVGNMYYRELVMRNLLEPDGQYYDQSGCTMHDLLRSFANYLAKDEALLLTQGQSLCDMKTKAKLRRLSVATENVLQSTFRDQKQLRALMILRSTTVQLEEFLHDLPKLRLLHLGGVNLTTLPPSLCDLKHLRYLELSGTMIDAIPDSIGDLRYLQYIGLLNCINLFSLPGSIVRLHRLRALHIKGASVNDIPRGIGRLQNLVELTGFLTQNDAAAGWNSLEELGHLPQLSLLYLSNLEKAHTGSVAKKADLQGKRHLRYLSLECTPRAAGGNQIKDNNTQQEKRQIEDVFDELCPPVCLENLSLIGFFGHKLPKWMSSGEMDLKYLRSIKLEDCTYCEQLPALGHLLSLDFLLIKHAPSIMRIGHEFFCSSNATQIDPRMLFPRLEKLGFDRLDGWEEWIWDKELEQAMPNIFSLKVTKCKLKYFPPGLVHQTRALKELIISEACNLTSVANFLLLSDLHLHANPNLEMIANLPKLRRLSVIQCPKLNALVGLTELQSITLQDYAAELFPQYLEETSAAKLEVFCNEELFKLITLQEGSEWCKIKNIQNVKAYAPKGGDRKGWYALYTKEPFSLTTNNKGCEIFEFAKS